MRAEHQAIAEAIAARDSDRAKDLTHKHLYRTRRMLFSQTEA
jgi:DNA-binding GntR family transcriptional regulator